MLTTGAYRKTCKLYYLESAAAPLIQLLRHFHSPYLARAFAAKMVNWGASAGVKPKQSSNAEISRRAGLPQWLLLIGMRAWPGPAWVIALPISYPKKNLRIAQTCAWTLLTTSVLLLAARM